MDNQRAEDSGYYAEDYEDYEELEDIEDDLDDDESIEAINAEEDDDDDDDDDEDIEAYLEDDLDDDETYEVDDDDDDDDDEGIEDDDDDDDEAFDGVYIDTGEADEAFPAERSRSRSRRIRRRAWADMKKARRLAKRRANLMKMRALVARKKAARNARRTQRKLSKKLRGISGSGRVSLSRFSKARGTGYVTAVLANGRRTKMMFKPALATRTDVNRLTRQISANGVKQTRAIRVQGKNIKLLKSAQGSAVKSLTAQQLKSSKLLTKQITDGDKNLDKRITKLVSNQKKSGRKQDVKMLAKVRDQQRRSTWNSVLIASAIPLYAAYGDRAIGDNANPLTKKNLFIAGSTTLFLFADDLIDRFLTRGSKKWRSASNIWNIAAPVANAAAVYYFMKDRQHERFVTGIDEVTGNTEVPVGLVPVGKDHGFDNFSSPPVVATLKKADVEVEGVKARVDQGKLYLTLTGSDLKETSKADVAWQVDTLNPDYKRKSGAASS